MKYIQAIKDKVVVEVLSMDKVTEGGIIIPEGASENLPHRFGKVISIGSEVKDVRRGDIIVFAKHGGMAITLEGKIYKTLMNAEIFGVFLELEENDDDEIPTGN